MSNADASITESSSAIAVSTLPFSFEGLRLPNTISTKEANYELSHTRNAIVKEIYII